MEAAGKARLLVLGGSGFLGPHLVAAASARAAGGEGPLAGALVVAASRDPDEGPRFPGDAAVRRRADALAPGAVEALLDELAPTHVVLATALSRVAECDAYPGLARALNAELAGRVAGSCERLGARLVHVSTDLVFGGQPPRGERYAEHDPPSPVHAYGRSKAEGEERCLAACGTALVARLPLLFGDSAGRGLGASDSILAAIDRGERPRLFTDEWRTPLDVSDAARALVELLELPDTGLLHVAGPERTTRHELGLLVLEAHGHPPFAARAAVEAVTRADLGMDAARPRDTSLDARRARALVATPLRAPAAALRARPPDAGPLPAP